MKADISLFIVILFDRRLHWYPKKAPPSLTLKPEIPAKSTFCLSSTLAGKRLCLVRHAQWDVQSPPKGALTVVLPRCSSGRRPDPRPTCSPQSLHPVSCGGVDGPREEGRQEEVDNLGQVDEPSLGMKGPNIVGEGKAGREPGPLGGLYRVVC